MADILRFADKLGLISRQDRQLSLGWEKIRI